MKVLVLGGNRFFGKVLVQNLLNKSAQVTVLNRGNLKDEFGTRIKRIVCDRENQSSFAAELKGKNWDIVYDQISYEAKDAIQSCEVFAGNVGHYVITSSQSVYGLGANISEKDFDAKKHTISAAVKSSENYAEGKRQVEAVFAQTATFPVSLIRYPIVLGEGDYTGRLKFHVDHVMKGQPIYFPNLEARISFVSAQDAAAALEHVGLKKILGPLNCCSSAPIKLFRLISLIEDIVQKKAKIASDEKGGDLSPFGIKADWYMNTEKLKASGLDFGPIENWIAPIIKNLSAATGS